MPLKFKKSGLKKRRVFRRKGIRRPLGRRIRSSNAVTGGSNTCKVVETLPVQNIVPNTPYIISVGGITGLRAQSIAPNFGLYRIAKITFRHKPNYDTYTSTQAGGNGALTVPTLYWKMNRFADAPAAFTAADLRVLGAKPVRFDDKQVTVAYRPSILIAQASGGSVSGSVKMTPWLNTDDAPDTPAFALSTTEHYGHFLYVECATAGTGAQAVGTWEATIVYEFKNPRTKWGASESAQSAVKLNVSSLSSM